MSPCFQGRAPLFSSPRTHLVALLLLTWPQVAGNYDRVAYQSHVIMGLLPVLTRNTDFVSPA